MSDNKLEVRESLSDPALLRAVGAAWRVLFFLLLQVDMTTKSYLTNPQSLAEAMGVTVGTLSSWIQRLNSLGIISVKSSDKKIKMTLLSPFNKIMLVTEEGFDFEKEEGSIKTRGFDESTTDLILRRRSSAINKMEEDIEFVFNKLQSLEMRLNALERSYQDYTVSQHKKK